MITRIIKACVGLSVCLLSSQGFAQNVTSQLRFDTDLKSYQIGTTNVATVKAPTIKLPPSIKWLEKQPTPELRNQGLKNIYESTYNSLKFFNGIKPLGGADGGGGSALICERNGHYTVELLDLWEARANRVPVDFGPGKAFNEKIDYVLNRLAKISPTRAHVYKAMLNDLLNNDTLWVSNAEMPIVNDTKLTIYPKGCLLAQAAVQNPIENRYLPNNKTYIINTDLLSLINDDSIAALFLHEIFYREARFSDIQNSLFVRSLVGLLAGPAVERYNLRKLNKLYENNGVRCLESLDFPVMFQVGKSDKNYSSCSYMEYVDKAQGEFKKRFFNFTPDPSSGIHSSVQASLTYEGRSLLFDRGDYYNFSDYLTAWLTVFLDGRLNYRLQDENGSSINLPIVLERGGFQFFTDSNPPTDSIRNEIAKRKSDWLQGRFFEKIKSLRYGYSSDPAFISPSMIIMGKSIRIDTPLLKFNSKCEESDEDCSINLIIAVSEKTEVIRLIDNSDTSKEYSNAHSSFLVYVGKNAKIATKNGWIRTSSIHIKDGKILRVSVRDSAPEKGPSDTKQIFYNLETQELEDSSSETFE